MKKIIFFLSFPISLFAQTFDQFKPKFDKKYEIGSYRSSYKMNNEQLAKQNDGIQKALYVLNQAKAAEGFGKYAEMDSLLKIGSNLLEKNADSTLRYAQGLKLIADTWMGFGNYQKASLYYKNAQLKYEKLSPLDTVQVLNLKSKYIKSILMQGFHNEAIAEINVLLPKGLKKLGIENLKAEKLGESYSKLPKLQRRRLAKEVAVLIAIRDAAWLKRGEYRDLDSNLTTDYDWVKKNVGRTSIEARDLLITQAQKYEIEKQKSKATSYYLKAFHRSKAKFSEKSVLDILEKVVFSYNAENDKHRSRKYYRKLESALFLQYGKKNPQYLRYELVDVASAYQFSKFNKSYKKLSKINRGKVSVPRNNPLHARLLKYSYDLDTKSSNYDQAQDTLKKLLEVKKYLYGETSPEYHKTKLEMANFLAVYANNFKVAQEIEDESWDKIVSPQLSPQNLEYTHYLQQLAGLYDLIDKYDLAIEQLNKSAETIQKYYGKENIAYANVLQKLAEEYIKKGDFKKGESLINEAVDLMKKVGTKENASNQAATYLTLSKLYTTIGNYDEAQKALKKAKKTSKKSKDSGANEAASKSADELADFYIKNGRYNDAENMLERTLFLKEKRFGKENKDVITTLNQMATLSLIKGNYGDAEKTINRSFNLTSKIFSDTSIKYAETVRLKEDLYKKIGEFSKAEESALQRLAIQKKQLGNNHIDIAATYSNLSVLKFYSSKDPEKSMKIAESGIKIVKDNIGTNNPQYANQITNLATFYIETKNYKKADSLLSEADKIWVNIVGYKNVNSADIAMLQGAIKYKQAAYPDAEQKFAKARTLYLSIFSDQHPGYVKASSKLAHTYYIKGQYEKSLKIMDEITQTYLSFTRKYFPSLSFSEKSKYWNLIKDDFEFFNSLAMKLKDKKPALLGKMYDMTMATKGILLSSSIKVRERVMSSKDDKLINRYNDWISKKEFLSSVISLSNESLKEMGVSVAQLEKEINADEKELSESSELFATNADKKTYSWANVKSTLKTNEYAIEILRFRKFNSTFSDTAIYAALIISDKTAKNPELVVLPNGKDLENKFLKYYRNATRNKVEDENSFHSYWEPIKAKIADNALVYISSEGVYNQINIEAMLNSNGIYAIDKNDFVLVGNTKDLVTSLTKERRAVVQKAVLIGNPTYYANGFDNSTVASSDRDVTIKKAVKKSTVIAKELQRDFKSYEEVPQLPGTEEEVNNIEGYLNTKNWIVKKYTGNKAEEDTLKAIRQPKLLHIATHGYFKEDVSADEVAGLSQTESEFSQNPLLRSGLLFKNAGDVLRSSSILDINAEKGVLTAYEAMNMNLDNTEIVLLSACETGRGEVQIGEGVLGLQRSFLVAGANTVVMSLFKVNDEVTQKLFTRFYELWLKNGDKRKAFTDAKREIKKIYPNPIYWASFVMSGI